MRTRWQDATFPIAHAHRGGSAERAENSVEAFENAVALGFRYVETDVRCTRDDRAVIWHDATLDRTSDRTGRVAELRWSELRRVGLRPPGATREVHHPLLLEELLDAWPDLRVTVDAKEDAVVGPLITALRRCRAEHRVCVGSFSSRRLRTIRRSFGPELCTATTPPEVARLRLASLGLPLRAPSGPGAALVPLRHLGVPVVDRRFVDHARSHGLGVHVWTVDDAPTMQNLLDVGVAGIMTDRPSLLRSLLLDRGAWSGT